MVPKLIGIGLSAVLLAGLLATPTLAKDDDTTFESPLVGSTPNQPIAGVLSGGTLWVVRRGEVTIEDDGSLKAEVQGLLLAGGGATGTTGGIPALAASVVCGGVVAASTNAALLSGAGDFQVRQVLTLPKPCRGVMVLLQIARAGVPLANYIAISGMP
jgi:hypothetical protein